MLEVRHVITIEGHSDSDNGQYKCLDNSGEMGNNLALIDLGTFIPDNVMSGRLFQCALSSVADGGQIKC